MDKTEHSAPCEAHKSFASSMKYIITILVAVGGAGISFSFSESHEAKREAIEAKNIAGNIEVLENNVAFSIRESKEAKDLARVANEKAQDIEVMKRDIAHIKGDMAEFKSGFRRVDEMRLQMTEMQGNINLILAMMKQVEITEGQ